MPLDLSATATSLLATLGSKTYVSAIETSATFDKSTGKETGVSEVSTLLTAAVLSVDTVLEDGTRISSSDNSSKKIIFSNEYTPTMSTIYEFGGDRYKTISIGGMNHAGTQQYWEVVCQR